MCGLTLANNVTMCGLTLATADSPVFARPNNVTMCGLTLANKVTKCVLNLATIATHNVTMS